MRTIAFLTQKGGAGKTTLAASLAVAAAAAGERVVALDFDPQGSLARWGKRRESANAPHIVVVEPLEVERLPRLSVIIDRLRDAGFTLAVFDTAGAHTGALGLVAECADLCLLPARPTLLDIEATAVRLPPSRLPSARPPLSSTSVRRPIAARARARRPRTRRASAFSPSRCCRRGSIFRTQLPPASALPSTPRRPRRAGNRSVLGLGSRPVGGDRA